MKLSTQREFKAVYHLNGLSVHEKQFSLNDFISNLSENDCEEIYYALDEIADDVLNLKEGESLYFKPNRDCKNSKAILVRIN